MYDPFAPISEADKTPKKREKKEKAEVSKGKPKIGASGTQAVSKEEYQKIIDDLPF